MLTSGGETGPHTTTRLRVRYAETDAMGIVYHTNYAVWFEVGRGDFFRALGIPYSESERRGVFFPVTELTVRYVAPAVFDDEVLVETRLETLRSRLVRFQYTARRAADGLLLTTGSTTHMCTDGHGQVRTIPDDLMQRLRERSGKRT